MPGQMVFPFIKEDNLLCGRTCEKCGGQEECVEKGETVSNTNTCIDWRPDYTKDQKQDSDEAMNSFDDLMDKYSISVDDRRLIYINCQHF